MDAILGYNLKMISMTNGTISYTLNKHSITDTYTRTKENPCDTWLETIKTELHKYYLHWCQYTGHMLQNYAAEKIYEDVLKDCKSKYDEMKNHVDNDGYYDDVGNWHYSYSSGSFNCTFEYNLKFNNDGFINVMKNKSVNYTLN